MSRILVVFIISSLVSCTASTRLINDSTPKCITEFIDKYKNDPRWQVSSVDEYEYQGSLVYAFNPSRNLADGAISVRSAECVDMCSIGGFAGPRNNQCNGDNFFEKAILKRTIWKRE